MASSETFSVDSKELDEFFDCAEENVIDDKEDAVVGSNVPTLIATSSLDSYVGDLIVREDPPGRVFDTDITKKNNQESDSTPKPFLQQNGSEAHSNDGSLTAETTTTSSAHRLRRRVSFHCDDALRQPTEVEVVDVPNHSTSLTLSSIPTTKDVYFEHDPAQAQGEVVNSPLTTTNWSSGEKYPNKEEGVGLCIDSSEDSLVSSFHDSSHSLLNHSLRSIDEKDNERDVDLSHRSIQSCPGESVLPCNDRGTGTEAAKSTSILFSRRKPSRRRTEGESLAQSWHPTSILRDSSYHGGASPPKAPQCNGEKTKDGRSTSSEQTEEVSSSRLGRLGLRRLSSESHLASLHSQTDEESSSRSGRLSLRRLSSRRFDPLSQSWHSTSYLNRQKPSDQADQSERESRPKRRPSLQRQVSLLLGGSSGLDLDNTSAIDYIIEDEKKNRSRFNLHWWYVIFLFCGISLFICLTRLFLPPPYGVWMTSAEVEEIGISPGCEDGLDHCICPRETICATNTLSIVLLTIARASVFFDYPLYMMMFLSKAHNLNNVCRRTILREWIDFGDMHKLHKLFGIVIGIETTSHSFLHMLRWGLNADVSFLWTTRTGITGLIALFITPFIVLPMAVAFLKERIRYEVRKGLHYLSVLWAAALLFHAPSKISFLIGIPALIYAVDYVLGYFWRNSLIENVFFERYGENGVALHFKNPQGWEEKPKTSYLYIMLPWISKYQWHAFTMFPEPQKENHTMLCIGASGDWTKELHERIKAPCYRQMYVIGPFKSQFADTAITTSNAIAVATGVGITPTLSLVLNYAGKKRINVVWICRDPGLVEYILHKVDVAAITRNSFVFIFYTGTRELALPKHLPANTFIFKSRPDLENTLSGIVSAIHSGEGLPETFYERQKKIAEVPFQKRMMIAMSRVTQIYDADEMFGHAVKETERAAEKMKAADLESGIPNNECPEDQVSLVGLDAMISKFLGVIGEYSRSDIEDVFKGIDRDASGYIDRSDFDAFLKMVTSTESTMCRKSSKDVMLYFDAALANNSAHQTPGLLKGSSHHASVGQNSLFGDSSTIEYMNKLMSDNDDGGRRPLEDWSIFYCGGSRAIHKKLQDFSKRYAIDLAVEKFDW